MPRIPYVDPEALPDDYEILREQGDELPDEISAEWWNEQPTVRAFGNNVELADAHVSANVAMWTESGLSLREVEYVILAAAREMGSAYEWHDHVIAALERAGLTKDEVLAISERDVAAMEDSKKALVEYAFEFVREYGGVSDDRHDALSDQYDESAVVGVAMLTGYYVFLHHNIEALGLEIEGEFVGWKLENY